jgi:hypothetical protein
MRWHLDDGVAGDEMDHEEDDRHDDPQHRQGGEDAAQDGARGFEAWVGHLGHTDILVVSADCLAVVLSSG